MATIAGDIKSGYAKNIRTAIEERTGIIGETLRAKREEQEREKSIQKRVDKIEQVTTRVKTTGSLYTTLETYFIQISKNVQILAEAMGASVTLEEKSKEIPEPVKRQPIAAPTITKQAGEVEADTRESESLIDKIFGKIKRKKAGKAAKRKARAKARQRRIAEARKRREKRLKEQAKQKQQAEQQRKKQQEENERKKKQAEKQKGPKQQPKPKPKPMPRRGRVGKTAADKIKKAPTKLKKVSKAVIRKAAKGILAKSLGKIAGKSIPIVGAVVGVGFALERLIKGDWVGAGLEAASGLGSAITAIPATIAQAVREVYQEVYGVIDTNDPLRAERYDELYTEVETMAKEMLNVKPVVAPQPAATGESDFDDPEAALFAAPMTRSLKPKGKATTVQEWTEPPAFNVPTAAPPPPAPTPQKKASVTSTPSASGGEAIMEEALMKEGLPPNAIAAIMAQTSHESMHFKRLNENLNYSASSLQKVFKKYFPNERIARMYARKPEMIANRVYGGRMGNGPEQSGDGWRYRGRGFIQLTGKNNYKAAGSALGIDLVNNPDLAQKPDVAAKIAIWYFKKNQRRIPDWSDVKRVTYVVNGGYIGLADRTKEFQSYLAKYQPAAQPGGADTGTRLAQASTDVATAKKKPQQGGAVIVAVNNTNQMIKKPPSGSRVQVAQAIT